jgi:hypothetical protein
MNKGDNLLTIFREFLGKKGLSINFVNYNVVALLSKTIGVEFLCLTINCNSSACSYDFYSVDGFFVLEPGNLEVNKVTS